MNDLERNEIVELFKEVINKAEKIITIKIKLYLKFFSFY